MKIKGINKKKNLNISLKKNLENSIYLLFFERYPKAILNAAQYLFWHSMDVVVWRDLKMGSWQILQYLSINYRTIAHIFLLSCQQWHLFDKILTGGVGRVVFPIYISDKLLSLSLSLMEMNGKTLGRLLV